MKKDSKFVVLTPPTRIKYKTFCKRIHNRYHKQYVYYVNDKPRIDIALLMEILINKLKPPINVSYVRNQKYEEKDFINGIIDVIQNNTYWNRFKGIVPGKYLNKKHNDYCKWDVYECLYRIVLFAYFSTNKHNKLHYQSIDSTFISNLYGADIYGRNQKYHKNGINATFIVDQQGTPFAGAINAGNRHDSKVVKEILKEPFFIEPNTKNVRNNNRYRQYMLGDSAYYNKDIYRILKEKGYTPITDANMRNTKDAKKRKHIAKIKRSYKKYQVKRLKVENCNAWVKKYPKISRLVEKTIKSYRGLLLLALSFIANNKII
jgi:hypothetical protein